MTKQCMGEWRILLIDDDNVVRGVIRDGLKLKGCQVLESDSGRRGIEVAKKKPVDLIVLDIILRDEDGFDICRQLKEDSDTKDIPIIFLSAREKPRERVKGLRLGAVDYVIKPFDLDELLTRIDVALRIKVGRQDSVAKETGTTKTDSSGALEKDAFIDQLRSRFDETDPDQGLLTVMLVRVDQAEELGLDELKNLTGKMIKELSEQVPFGSLVGQLESGEVGVLLSQRNKYTAELLMDELNNTVAARGINSQGREMRLTFSCGVAEYPHPLVSNCQEFIDLAHSALRRAIRQGGDQAVLI